MIFPDWTGRETERPENGPLPLYTEWAVDWEKNAFALRDGEPYTVTGTQALRIWVRLALLPGNQRFFYSAHSPDYGNELWEAVGETGGIQESRVRQYIREALLVCPYITGVDGFAFARRGSTLEVSFTVRTVYDDFAGRMELETI